MLDEFERGKLSIHATNYIRDLEAALIDAYPFLCVAVDRYRREHNLTKLHEVHEEIADRIAKLLGQTRMPSKVLIDDEIV